MQTTLCFYSRKMGGIQQQLNNTQQAKKSLLSLTASQKAEILDDIATALKKFTAEILEKNQFDLDQMDPSDSRYDRLKLTELRISDLADSVTGIAKLPDPTNQLISSQKLKNGLLIEKKTVALGVVGVIYESRPNVTVDVAALCIQSGNVCLLRGGSDAWNSNNILVQIIQQVLAENDVDPNIVQLLPTDRAYVADLLNATRHVDILIPRGSQSLIDFVRENAKVPVIETGAGVCHTYVDETADLDMAAKIIANAKISRPSVCNALDTILVHELVASDLIKKLQPYFEEANVEVFAERILLPFFERLNFKNVVPAQEADFGREFLDFKCSIRSVKNLEAALQHIAQYSSKHSECIVSSNPENISTFMNTVDAAAVYVNASTRFTDGGEFGLGAEIGISTQKLHARGPFALEKLVTEKWFVTGNGQIR